jgi:hypothetical protein
MTRRGGAVGVGAGGERGRVGEEGGGVHSAGGREGDRRRAIPGARK